MPNIIENLNIKKIKSKPIQFKPIERLDGLIRLPNEWNLHYWGGPVVIAGFVLSGFSALLALDSAQAGLTFSHQLELSQLHQRPTVVPREQFRPLSLITSYYYNLLTVLP